MADTQPAKPVPFLIVAYAFVIVMAGATLPSPLYAIYQAKFGFTALTVTVLFAVYAVAVVLTLVLFGRLSDDIGRKPVLIAGVVASLLSAVAFLNADGVAVMLLGRVLSGVSAGLVTGTATAALLDLGGSEKRSRSSLVALAVNTGGLGFGTLAAGFLADWVDNPLRTPFLIDIAVTVVALIGLAFMPDATGGERTWRLRLQKPIVPKEVRSVFIRTSLAAGSGFAVTGVITAVSSIFLARQLHMRSHALAGAIVAMALGTAIVGQLIVRRVSSDKSLLLGCVLLIVSPVCIATALTADSLTALIVGALATGIGGGMCTGAGLNAIGAGTRPEHRGATASSFFIVVYTGLSLPTIAVGLLQQQTDLVTAGVTFSIVVAVLVALVLADLARRSRVAA